MWLSGNWKRSVLGLADVIQGGSLAGGACPPDSTALESTALELGKVEADSLRAVHRVLVLCQARLQCMQVPAGESADIAPC